MARYPGAVQRQLRQYDPRTLRPWILGVGHITANPGNPIMSAVNEINWRAGDLSVRNSATFFIDRDGKPWQALDPATQVAWTNGDVQNPDTSKTGIARLLREGVNGNAACYFTAEMVGNENRGLPVNDAQLKTFGALLRFYSRESGIPINRDTVLGHRHFNRIGRYNCPTRGNLDALLGRAIAYAGVVPNTAVPKGRDLYEWVATMGHQKSKVAIVKKGTMPLKNPDGTPHSKAGNDPAFVFPEDTRVEVIGGVFKGKQFWAGRRIDGNGLFLIPAAGVKGWV